MAAHDDGVTMQGSLYKWTNYMKGFQLRYFVLDRGILSYYKNAEERNSTCRGTMVLKDARIERDFGTNFAITQGDKKLTTTFHLRAETERSKSQWIEAIERAKEYFAQQSSRESGSVRKRTKSVDTQQSDAVDDLSSTDSEEDEGDEEVDPTLSKELNAKLVNLQKQQQLLFRSSQAMKQRCDSLPEGTASELRQYIQALENNAGTLVNLSSEYLNEVFIYQKKWSKLLTLGETKRKHLEEQLEQLAKEHIVLERGASRVKERLSQKDVLAIGRNDSEDEFYDATDDLQATAAEEEEEVPAPTAPPRRVGGGHSRTVSSESGTSTTTASAVTNLAIIAQMKKFKPRDTIAFKPNKKMSLWSVMKNCIGKDLSKIPMPVHFNEPLSFTQRLSEDLEYSTLLDRAVQCESSIERMVYVTAFTVSPFATSTMRVGKPFNPLLGETYELDHTYDLGWRTIMEQVSHHPPICAQYTDHPDWTFWQEFSMLSKFRGAYLEIVPTGISHLIFKKSGDHYTWTKVSTTVHNIIVGKLWVDYHGTMIITNHTTGDLCKLTYNPYSYFSNAESHSFDGIVSDISGTPRKVIHGVWDGYMKAWSHGEESTTTTTVWERLPWHPDALRMYGFTGMSCTLNQIRPIDKGAAPTDARLRPDVRLMEEADWDKANEVKGLLEEAQRKRRKEMEKRMQQWEPIWFSLQPDPCIQSRSVYQYKGGYWEAKEAKDWSKFDLADIYNISK